MNRLILLVGALALTAAGCAGSRSDEPTEGVGTPPTSSSGPGTEPLTSPVESVPGSNAAEAPAPSVPTGPTDLATRPMSTTVLPTIQPPTAPPSLPSDQLTGLWVVGTVTTAGEGSCSTVTADDGRVLTLSGGGPLVEGDRVKVRIVQPPRAVYCGDVEAWTLLEVAPAG